MPPVRRRPARASRALTRALARAALLALAPACLARGPQRLAPSAAPEFRPEAFFAGRTHGVGTLVVRGRGPRALRVEGEGRVEADGTFRLDQRVTAADGSVEMRTWRLRRVDDRTYAATLSDARGPVTAEADGNRLHLRYEIRRPAVAMEQWLYLEPDRRTVRNVATVTVLGVPWARLTESITRDAPVGPGVRLER